MVRGTGVIYPSAVEYFWRKQMILRKLTLDLLKYSITVYVEAINSCPI